MNLLGNVIRGAVAGVAATVVVTGVLAVARQAGILNVPTPPRTLRRVWAQVTGTSPAVEGTKAIAAKVGLGAGAGALHGLLAGRRRTSPWVGALYGAGVWLIGRRAGTPALRLLPAPGPAWTGWPTASFLGHIVYGGSLAAVERLLQKRRITRRDISEYTEAGAAGDALASAAL